MIRTFEAPFAWPLDPELRLSFLLQSRGRKNMTFVETLIGGYIICFAIGCMWVHRVTLVSAIVDLTINGQLLWDYHRTSVCLFLLLWTRRSLDEMAGCSCDVTSSMAFSYSIWIIVSYRFLETVHSAVYLRQMYVYSVLALSNPLNLFVIDWYVSHSYWVVTWTRLTRSLGVYP